MLSEKFHYREKFRKKTRNLGLAKLMFKHPDIGESRESFEQRREKWIRHMEQNRKNCSCHMCRNPRHSKLYKPKDRLTLQERKAALD